MGNWGTSFGYGFARSMQLGTLALASRAGFYNTGFYNTSGISYMDTLYCDLDSPSGLTSWVDNGYMINNYGYIGDGQFLGGYTGGYTGSAFCGIPVGGFCGGFGMSLFC